MRPMRLVAPTTRTVVFWAPGIANSHMGPSLMSNASRASLSSARVVLDICPNPENFLHTSSNICLDFLPSPTGFTSSKFSGCCFVVLSLLCSFIFSVSVSVSFLSLIALTTTNVLFLWLFFTVEIGRDV